MEITPDPLVDDAEALRAQLILARARADEADAALAAAMADRSDDQALILHLQLMIEKLKRALYGHRSEKTVGLLNQMELQLEELQASAAQDGIAAEAAARKAKGKTTTVAGFERKHPVRKPFPEHLPRERQVLPAPTACTCCGSERLRKISESFTETLEAIRRSYKVIQYVTEKFSCRDCEKISQAPAPFHVIPRGWAGPSLLALIAYEKFVQHKPLNRLAEQFASEGVPLSLSTLADQLGAVCTVIQPVFECLEAHVFAAERLHGDDTPVKVLAKGHTTTGRLWDYIRDDRPFGGTEPPGAIFYYSPDRSGEHPQSHLARYAGILQADAFAGYEKLYQGDRRPAPITEAACWAHSRRRFFELADIEAMARKKKKGKNPKFISPVSLEAVKRIDALFAIEREINGCPPEERKAVRQERSAPLVADLKTFLVAKRANLPKDSDAAKAIDYMLNRWEAFAGFLGDGRICMSNNAAERAIRGVAVGRKAWLFFGSDRGGQRAAMMYSLFMTCRLNGVEEYAWLADVLARIAEHPARRVSELLPWNWTPLPAKAAQAA